MRNNARPDFVLESEFPLQPQQLTDLRREWRRLYTGTSNANKVAILHGGLHAKPLNFSPKEVSYIAGEDRVMRRVGMAFGIPKSMLTTDDVNLANAEIGERQHAKYTLLPRLTADCETLTKGWVVDYDPKLFLGFDNPVKENEKAQAETDQIRISSGVRTINEIRARDDLPPLEGGDEAGFQRTERQSTERAEAQAAQMALMQQQQPQQQPPPAGNEPGKAWSVFHDCTCTNSGYGWKAPEWEDTPEELALAAAMRAVFVRVRRDLLGRSKAAKAIVPPGSDDLLTPSEAAAIRVASTEATAMWEAATAAAMLPHIRGQLATGWDIGVTVLERAGVRVDVAFDVFNPEVAEFVENYTLRLAGEVTVETQSVISGHVRAALESGETTNQLRDRLTVMADGFEKSRATTIARTEMSRASQQGELESWRESGEVIAKVWRRSDSACEFCLAMDGTVVALEENFAGLGSEIAGVDDEGNPTGRTLKVNYESVQGAGGINMANAHPNCRCTLIPQLRER
jgi:hypothetical protein